MPQTSLLDVARQGNPRAISLLLNAVLMPKQVKAIVTRSEANLTVALQSEKNISQAAAVTLIRTALEKLLLPDIKAVYIEARCLGVPLWEEEFFLISQAEHWNLTLGDMFEAEPEPAAAVAPSPPNQAEAVEKVKEQEKPQETQDYDPQYPETQEQNYVTLGDMFTPPESPPTPVETFNDPVTISEDVDYVDSTLDALFTLEGTDSTDSIETSELLALDAENEPASEPPVIADSADLADSIDSSYPLEVAPDFAETDFETLEEIIAAEAPLLDPEDSGPAYADLDAMIAAELDALPEDSGREYAEADDLSALENIESLEAELAALTESADRDQKAPEQEASESDIPESDAIEQISPIDAELVDVALGQELQELGDTELEPEAINPIDGDSSPCTLDAAVPCEFALEEPVQPSSPLPQVADPWLDIPPTPMSAVDASLLPQELMATEVTAESFESVAESPAPLPDMEPPSAAIAPDAVPMDTGMSPSSSPSSSDASPSESESTAPPELNAEPSLDGTKFTVPTIEKVPRDGESKVAGVAGMVMGLGFCATGLGTVIGLPMVVGGMWMLGDEEVLRGECPHCGQALKVPLGKLWRFSCPSCQGLIQIKNGKFYAKEEF